MVCIDVIADAVMVSLQWLCNILHCQAVHSPDELAVVFDHALLCLDLPDVRGCMRAWLLVVSGVQPMATARGLSVCFGHTCLCLVV